MEKEDAIEKVKKLFALAGNNSSEEEATMASLKAQEIMVKYGLEKSDIKDEDLKEDICTVIVDSIPRAKPWRYALASIIAKNFKCTTWKSNDAICFMGHLVDVNIAKQTFVYIYKVGHHNGSKMYSKYMKEFGTAKNVYNNYTSGFLFGLSTKFDSQSKALAVVVPDDVKEEFAKKEFAKKAKFHPAANTKSTVFKKGFYDGKNLIKTNEADMIHA